jgi:hypothetical protein
MQLNTPATGRVGRRAPPCALSLRDLRLLLSLPGGENHTVLCCVSEHVCNALEPMGLLPCIRRNRFGTQAVTLACNVKPIHARAEAFVTFR